MTINDYPDFQESESEQPLDYNIEKDSIQEVSATISIAGPSVKLDTKPTAEIEAISEKKYVSSYPQNWTESMSESNRNNSSSRTDSNFGVHKSDFNSNLKNSEFDRYTEERKHDSTTTSDADIITNLHYMKLNNGTSVL
jgi:hypothetical protein